MHVHVPPCSTLLCDVMCCFFPCAVGFLRNEREPILPVFQPCVKCITFGVHVHANKYPLFSHVDHIREHNEKRPCIFFFFCSTRFISSCFCARYSFFSLSLSLSPSICLSISVCMFLCLYVLCSRN